MTMVPFNPFASPLLLLPMTMALAMVLLMMSVALVWYSSK